MLKQKFFLILIIVLTIGYASFQTSFAQDWAAVLGEDKGYSPDYVFRFQVRDNETHMPISNANITLENINRKVFSLRTDEQGVGVVVVMQYNDYHGGTFKVIAQNYHYQEMEGLSQFGYKEKIRDFPLVLPGMKYDWSFSDHPSVRETLNAVKMGNYEIYKNINVAPGCFEYTFNLERVDNYRPEQDFAEEKYENKKKYDLSKNTSNNANSADNLVDETKCAITITFPNSRSNWRDKTIETIKWISTDVDSDVEIELYKRNTRIGPISYSEPNDGVENWSVSNFRFDTGSKYRIKIISKDDPSCYGFSDYFTITE